MGQLRTANKRRKRAAIFAQANKTAAPVATSAPSKPAPIAE